MNEAEKALGHLAVACIARLAANKIQDPKDVSLDTRIKRDNLIINFFSGAYFCARVCRRDVLATEIAVHNTEMAKGHAYARVIALAALVT